MFALGTNPATAPGKSTVLIIDDDEVIRQIGGEMVQYLGFKCLTAEGGAEGIALFRKNVDAIGLVILDVEMPGLSGEKVSRLLREIDPRVRLLIASGYSKEHLENKVFKSQIEHFISKPFNLENLAHQIRRLLPEADVH